MTIRELITGESLKAINAILPKATMRNGPQDVCITGLGWQVKIVVEPMDDGVVNMLDVPYAPKLAGSDE